MNNTPYAKMVSDLEADGLTTSDAQGVADVEFAHRYALRMLHALRRLTRCPALNMDDLEIEDTGALLFARQTIAMAEGITE